MVVSGAITSTFLYAAVAPQAALVAMFGGALQGPLAEIVVRNLGALVTLMGGMLFYGAFNLPSRPLILIVVGLSKLFFIAMLLAYGSQLPGGQVGISIVTDSVVVMLFVVYLIGARRAPISAR